MNQSTLEAAVLEAAYHIAALHCEDATRALVAYESRNRMEVPVGN